MAKTETINKTVQAEFHIAGDPVLSGMHANINKWLITITGVTVAKLLNIMKQGFSCERREDGSLIYADIVVPHCMRTKTIADVQQYLIEKT